ncbi:MAG: O-antigen ligase family protein [Lachnospiraceae bacterium]|nr:O-antigen ligase family protein [Lachnospiraceae bacterium]
MSRAKVLSSRKKQKKKPDLLRDIQELLSGILNVLISLYMLLIMVGMPFYFTDGYERIGTNKYEFLYNVSTKMAVVLLPFACIYVGLWLYTWVKKKGAQFAFRKSLSLTDYFALAYAVVVVISYLCSAYQEATAVGDALKGARGWYMGLVSQLIFVAVYFAVSRFWKGQKWMLMLWVPVTFVLYVLAFLNRFDVRPIEMKNATPEFISTIGNMNWYCGYIIVLFSGILYYIWAKRDWKPWGLLLMWVWLTMGFASLMTQGSQSGILALGVVLIVLYLLSMRRGEDLQRFWSCLLCMGVACMGTYVLRTIFEEQYNYEDGISVLLTFSPLAIVIFVMTVVLCVGTWYLQKKDKVPVKAFTILGYVGCGAVAVVVVAFLILGVLNTKHPGSIGALSELSIFTFDYEWGSLRGATWAAGVICFRDQNLLGKLIGVGPDSMGSYIHSGVNPEMLAMVKEYFNSLSLTNAHCEWLTALVNTGVLGMVSYAGLMISAIVRFFKARNALPLVGACGFGVLAYTVNNLVSFQQSMSTITVFIVLGMGEAWLRANKKH